MESLLHAILAGLGWWLGRRTRVLEKQDAVWLLARAADELDERDGYIAYLEDVIRDMSWRDTTNR